MPSFDGYKPIILQPYDSAVCYQFLLKNRIFCLFAFSTLIVGLLIASGGGFGGVGVADKEVSQGVDGVVVNTVF